MAEVVTFVGYQPPQRFDGHPWTQVRVEEASDQTGSYTALETIALSPLDTDPTQPQLRNFTTELGTALDYWYRVVFVDGTGDVSQPTTPVQNSPGSTVTEDVYGTTAELARILKLRALTPEQTGALERVLAAASGEVNSEIDRTSALAPWQIMLATEVTLERAVEHWQQEEVPYGIWENALGPVVVGRDTWDRHALKLAPLKQNWGMA